MSLKHDFAVNLRRLRRLRQISQMKLAEKCDTITSYIGELEIERKFPSIDMIEKIAGALGVEAYTMLAPYREKTAGETMDEADAALSSLSGNVKNEIAGRLKTRIAAVVDEFLTCSKRHSSDIITP